MVPESDRIRFARLVFYAVVLLVGYLAFRVVRPFLQPLGWAAIFAIMLAPVQRRLGRRLGPGWAAFVLVAVAAIILVSPAIGLLSVLVREVAHVTEYIQQVGLAADTPGRVEALWEGLRARVPFALPEDPRALAGEAVQRVGGFVAARAGAVLQNVASFVFSLVVMLFALFFFLRDGPALGAAIRDLLPFAGPRRDRLIAQTRDLVIASVGAGLAVAAVQGLLGGVAFALLGFPAPALWGLAMGFASLLPLVGSALVWLPAAAWLALSGEVVRGLVLAGVGAGIIGMVDNVLRPIILSGRTTVNGLVIFIGLLGGAAAFGFIGLVLGPVVLVAAGTLIEAAAAPDEAEKSSPATDGLRSPTAPGAQR